MRKIKIATRGSHLALAQAKYVERRLIEIGFSTEIIIIKTTGDINYSSFSKLAKQGDQHKGLFTKEIEEALLAKKADIAVHSLKDMPTRIPQSLIVAALPQRLDFRDYWVFPKKKKVQNIFPFVSDFAKVGTSSFRRKALLNFLKPSLQIMDIRGNVPTRIRKLFSPDGPDAILLSGAGIERLSFEDNWIEKEYREQIEMIPLEADWFPPAPGQGTIAVECRRDDHDLISILKKIHDSDIEEVIQIERGILGQLEGGCHLPLGVYAKKEQSYFQVYAFLGKEYPFGKRNYKDFYICRYHKDSKRLIQFISEEFTLQLPVVVLGKAIKNQILKEKLKDKKKYIIFYDMVDILYKENFKKIKIYGQLQNDSYIIYAIFSAEGIRALRKKNFQFPDKNFKIFLNGKKSKEVLQKEFPLISEENIIISPDGTAEAMVDVMIEKLKEKNLYVIAVSPAKGRKELIEKIKKANFPCEQWIVYETHVRNLTVQEISLIPEKCYIIFGSPSIFDAFYHSFHKYNLDFHQKSKDWRFLTLGKTTFHHIYQKGFSVYAMSSHPDYELLIKEIL